MMHFEHPSHIRILVPPKTSGPKKEKHQRIDKVANLTTIHVEHPSQIRFLVPPQASGPNEKKINGSIGLPIELLCMSNTFFRLEFWLLQGLDEPKKEEK